MTVWCAGMKQRIIRHDPLYPVLGSYAEQYTTTPISQLLDATHQPLPCLSGYICEYFDTHHCATVDIQHFDSLIDSWNLAIEKYHKGITPPFSELAVYAIPITELLSATAPDHLRMHKQHGLLIAMEQAVTHPHSMRGWYTRT